MSRKRTGQARFRSGKWTARVTLGPKNRPTFTLSTFHTLADAEQAKERAGVLAEIGANLRAAGALDLADKLLTRAAACTDAELPTVLELVAAVTNGNYVADGSREGMTFKELAKKWTTGELARDYPDHVKDKKSASDDLGRLQKYIYPLVADVPLKAFALDHAERAMAALPASLSSGSRRQYAQLIHRVLSLAVFPLRVIKASPIPRGWLPKPAKRKAKAFLYPDEEALVLKHTAIPLVARIAYGVLAREGMRKEELLALDWSDLDLERGKVTLDENKTDEPRAWKLGDDVAEALRQWRAMLGAPVAGPVLVDDDGERISELLAVQLRRRMKDAGLTRKELFTRGKNRLPYNIHGHRGTFVTLALAIGRTEAWVTDRTGHKSSGQIYTYKRSARTAEELDLGWLQPMHETIPELAKGADLRVAKGAEKAQPLNRGRRHDPTVSETPTISPQCAREDLNLHTLQYRILNRVLRA